MSLAAQHAEDYQQQRVRRMVQRNYDRIFYVGPEGLALELPMVRGGAGSYPDAPSRRMALDDDGTFWGRYNTEGGTGAMVEISEAVQETATDEENTNAILWVQNVDGYFHHIFPELRELDGYFLAVAAVNTFGVYTSGDTTNGYDGTWTQRQAPGTGWFYTDNYANYRSGILSAAVSNVRGVRLTKVGGVGSNDDVKGWHLYGEISAGETPDRLLWFDDNTDLEFSKPIDYGDKPRGSAEDYVVYLKNNSGSLSANSVQITAEDLYLGSGSWFTFAEGAGSFQSTLALGSSIGSAANSANITIRVIRPDAATVGLHAARAYANVGSWT